MTRSGRERRLPRSYRSGRLLALVANDFPGHAFELLEPGRGRLEPDADGISIDIEESVDRRFLGHTEIARFLHLVEVPTGNPALLRVGHTGKLRRQGVEVTVTRGDQDDASLAERISQDPSFTVPGLALDFTRFEAERSTSRWTVAVELMGASFVSLALPPMRSYVRLHVDQREALLGALTALRGHLAQH